jgi:threonine aldolase
MVGDDRVMADEMTMDPAQRRFEAVRGCERQLSGLRPKSLREGIAALGEGSQDLDGRPDVYGNGVVETLERRVADLLGTEAAAFFPTGTMAQQVALRCWSERTGDRTVAMHPLAHPELHERFAYAQLSGLRSVWPTTERRMPTADEIAEFPEPFGTLFLELPLREAGFLLPDWEDLVATVEAARDRDAVVHFDGARLWETVHHFGRPLPEVAGLADSVYVSFYKTLGGISGAALAGPEAYVAQAKTWRHRYGGQLYQQWPVALSALAGIERELPRLGEYVAQAMLVAGALAEAVAGVPGARVFPEPPHTQQFQLWLPFSADALNEAGVVLAERTRQSLFGTWREPGLPGISQTEVTIAEPGLAWSAQDVRTAVGDFLGLLG